MSRSTSIAAYAAFKDSGMLETIRGQVYDYLYKNGPLTQNEISQFGFPNIQIDSVKPRIAELKKMGVVTEVGKSICRVTGKEVLKWDVTDKLPLKFQKPVSIKDKLKLAEEIIGAFDLTDLYQNEIELLEQEQ